ncbi:MAG: hypothetical protein E6G97_19380 [Alphaproteobacteria bacterium]|nr:MAG: hypothetical protein E6G97_19380 [Alphaproteobacteria bacterium]
MNQAAAAGLDDHEYVRLAKRRRNCEEEVIAVTNLPAAERAALLKDHLQTQEVLDQLADEHREEFDRPPQPRHVLLYLLFPDDYERIASEGHKARICEAFREIIDGDRPDDADDSPDGTALGPRALR